MVATSSRPPANGFVHFMRKIYNPIGFSKGYNASLWFIFAGALFGFTLARLQYLSIGGIFKDGSSPGEWYYLNHGFRRIGITLHLAAILPCSLLVVLQFTPFIRHKFLLFHRISGYLAILLLLIANAGALMIARYTFGGGLETQTMVGLLAIMTTGSIAMAYYNIKKLQIEQHRAWMLRTWFYAASIITLRIIMISSASIITMTGGMYRAMKCDEIKFAYDQRGKTPDDLATDFPSCLLPNSTYIAVPASMNNNAVTVSTALGISFGMAGWLALFIHAVGVEIYLQLTPRESERLRRVSYERQLERGMKNPGSAGLVVERFGDADGWCPDDVVGKVGEAEGERR